MKKYTTVQGDMWDSIAYRTLGSVQYTDRLMMLNRKYLHLYTFPAGIVLTLPDVRPESRPAAVPWKNARG